MSEYVLFLYEVDEQHHEEETFSILLATKSIETTLPKVFRSFDHTANHIFLNILKQKKY